MLSTLFQPRSSQSEAVRSLRTSLLYNHENQTNRVIQVTGPSPDDGASLIAANLAVSIAQLGKKVLLIDADLHRPRQHELFGIDSDISLSSMHYADEPLINAAKSTVVENLWVLPAGNPPTDGCELFSTTHFAQLLDTARERFDYVLVDTEPLLAVSDPCVIASQVDRVLLALRPTKDSRWRAERAKEMLDTLGVVPIGVVVNGVGGSAARSYRGDASDLKAEVQ